MMDGTVWIYVDCMWVAGTGNGSRTPPVKDGKITA